MDLLAAFKAQAAFVSERTAYHAEHGYTDDDVDYLPGMLALLEALQSDHYEGYETCLASKHVVAEYGMYAGDFGPQSVFDFLGAR